MGLRFSRFLLFVVVIALCGGIPAWAFLGAEGFSSPEMVMDAWSRAVRQRDTEMFAACYWGNARQLIVTADGDRSNLSGVNAIAEDFRRLLAVHDADTTGFWLPVPLRYRDPEHDALQFIYRDRSYPAINMVQFEERDGRWAIAEQHIYWRNLSAYRPGPTQQPYDSDGDGTLNPAEQNAMVEAYWLVTTGRHGAITPLDEYFDFDRNGYVSDTESRRARSVLLRDRLRTLPAIYPIFAEQYLDTTASGEVTIHAANTSLKDFIDSETAIRPGPVSETEHAVADFDEDGWIGRDEIYAYAEMLVRVLAAIPEPLSFSKETDGSTEEIVLWTDGNSDGIISDTELNDLGYLVFAALSGDPIVASAPLYRFDQNRDFLLSVPEQDALRAYFAIELLPQTVARFSDTYPIVSLLDTDGSGELGQIEIGSAMELISDPDGSVGSGVNSPLDRLMDRKPEDGYLSEWEVWSVVGTVLAASSRQWIESRMGDSTIVRFERKTGISRTEIEDEELVLRSSTAPIISNDVSSLLRAARFAGYTGADEAGADEVGAEPVRLTMPAGAVVDETVRLAARLDPVFPVMYKWYADRHIGYAYVENTSDETITDIVARVNIPRLADSAIDSPTVSRIDSKEVIRIAIPVLLNETAVLAITEGRTAAATVEVEYTSGAERQTISQTVQLEFYDRNAIMWDDDRKAAAFVTARDDQVMLFSGNLHASMYGEFRAGLNRELQLAMLMFVGLAEHGVVYRTDPSSPYVDYSQDQFAIDYLQFPRQTLAFRNGDCDDLSVAYAALIEAVGVPAAFITTPGHIFVGVGLNTTEDEARRTFLFPDDMIYTDSGDVWLPVELTAIRGTFLEAWSVAARQWRDANRRDDDARVIPIRSAWQEYAPVGFSGFTFPLSAPDSPRVVERSVTELTQFVAREIADREATFLGRLDADPSDHELRNRLGALYARYGLMDKAAVEFERVVDQVDFYPAFLNLGNITYMAGDYPTALGHYERAVTLEPESGPAILGVARASLEVEDYPRVREAYDRLKVVSPGLASEHSYLESRRIASSQSTSSRAGETSGRNVDVIWVDER
ncbi:MAG: hypothetical protein V3S41_05250 [Spirochaetia bacterium]